jgi:hypothetical protein
MGGALDGYSFIVIQTQSNYPWSPGWVQKK